MKKIFLLLVLGLVGKVALCGTIIMYTNATDWETQVNTITGGAYTIITDNFNSGSVAAPVVVTSTSGGITNTDGSTPCGLTACLWNDTVGNGATTTWFLNFALVGWGGTFNVDSGGPGLRFSFTGNTPFNAQTVSAPQTNQFIGFVVGETGSYFWDVTVDAAAAGTQHYTMDDMVYTPEPGAWLLLGTGLLGLCAAFRRRKSV